MCLCRGYVFRAQIQEIKERGGNQSTGIDFYITQERVIFLDTQVRLKHQRLRRFTVSQILYLFIYHSSCSNVIFYTNVFLQPILSPSILDRLINNECKLPPEYNLPHTYVEMQVSEGPAGGTEQQRLI